MTREEGLKKFGPIFVEFFDEQWLDLYLSEVRDAQLYRDEQNKFMIPRALFWGAWQQVKRECAEYKIILNRTDVEKLCLRLIPNPEIWRPLLEEDSDWDLFERMAIDKGVVERRAQANTMARKEIDRQSLIRTLIRQYLIRSAQKTMQIDRLEVYFFEELTLLTNELINNCIYCTAEELKKLISEEITGLPSFIIDLVNTYTEKLGQIRAPAAEMEFEVISISEIEEKPIEPLRVKELSIQQKTPETAPQVVFEPKEYTITDEGVKKAIESLLPYYKPMDYYKKIKDLLEKIKIHCRDTHRLPQLLKIVHNLKQGEYLKKYNKDDKSDQGLKMGFIYAALGLLEASLCESLAPMFMGKTKVTIKN
jgi:hypothetical protein